MDSAALNELIAEIRSTRTSLADAEQKVAAFTAELAEQDHGAQLNANPELMGSERKSTKKRAAAGRLPAGGYPDQRWFAATAHQRT